MLFIFVLLTGAGYGSNKTAVLTCTITADTPKEMNIIGISFNVIIDCYYCYVISIVIIAMVLFS
jgi:hypothetical protein